MLVKYINTEVLLGIVYTNYTRLNKEDSDSQLQVSLPFPPV